MPTNESQEYPCEVNATLFTGEKKPFDRRNGIGASMAPAVCGVSEWESPLAAYLWYVGQLPDKEVNEQMEIGTEIENTIRALTEKRLGLPITKPETKQHPNVPWAYASPDGLLSPKEGFEAKNVGYRQSHKWGEPGTDEIPESVIIQAHHQMWVFDLEKVFVSALLCGSELRFYSVPRNDKLLAIIEKMEAEFWERVQARNPPPPDWTDPDTPDLIKAMHQPIGGSIELDDASMKLAEDYKELGKKISTMEKERDVAKARLIEIMGEATEGLLPSGEIISRSITDVKEKFVKAYSFQQFRIKKARKKVSL